MNDEIDDVVRTCNWNSIYLWRSQDENNLWFFEWRETKPFWNMFWKSCIYVGNSMFYIFEKMFMKWHTASSKSYCKKKKNFIVNENEFGECKLN